MKRLLLLVGLTLLTVVGTAATSQAYYLDTPHNESNGIMCYTCHTAAWYTYTSSGGVDDTIFNYVCLRCHDEVPADVAHQGPSKHLHASSTTSTDKGTWSTGCSQCHDPHFQGQLDWAADPGVWLAQGQFGTPSNRVFSAADPLGGGYGTTAVTITGVTGKVGWTTTATWTGKGGNMAASRATDNSRGLVFAPNKANPTDTYEIVSASDTTLKVKGNMPSTPNGQTFGVVYGQSLRSIVFPNGGTTVAHYRNVKFFQPTIIAGTVGGYIDETPAAVKPQGLCQVCHTATEAWTKDGAILNGIVKGNVHNAANDPCANCHDILTGGSGAPNHAAFIQDRLGTGCGACHSSYTTAPETAHGASCGTCHAITPEINTNLMVNEAPTSVNVLANILNGGYAGGTTGVRLTYGGFGIGDAGFGFQIIDCGECHEAKPAAVVGGSHGGHSNTHFAWDGNCADCHTAPTGNIVNDLHGRLISGSNCKHCHAPVNVDASDYSVRREGDPTNGIDGDARGKLNTATCTGCHNTNTPGVIHHDSLTGYAAAANCTVCHATAGHQGNHTARVATYINCSTCHAANVGSAAGAPVNSSDARIHDNCVTCHNTNSTLKTLVQVGGTKVIAMPNGGVGTNNGGGTCAACHGEYFPNHTNITHTTRVGGAVACVSCHTATAGTATTVPVSAALNKVHDACTTCHNANGTLRAAYGKAPSMAAPGGSCTFCHGAYFPNHVAANHATRIADTANCSSCHAATAGLITGAPINGADGKVHDACNTCHNDLTNNLLKAAYGKAPNMAAPGGDCNFCHAAYFPSHTNASHTARVAVGLTGCDSCHTATAGTATTVPLNAGDNKVHDTCGACHNTTNGALLAVVATGGSVNIAAGDCGTCHGVYFPNHLTSNHLLHVAGTANCTACHTGTAGTALTAPVSPADGKVHDACGTCHQANGALLAVVATGGSVNIAAGDCNACHGTYFASHTNASHTARVATTINCSTCHTATAGTATTVPLGPADGKVHDTCGTCHNLTNGTLLAAYGKASAMPVGGGDCNACHGVYFGSHVNANHTARVATTTNCSTCHTGTAGTATSVPLASLDGKVHDTCGVCHNLTNGALLAAYGKASAMPVGGGNCNACHGVYFPSHVNASHTARVAGIAACTSCHTGTAGTATTVPVSAVNDKVHDACAACHNTTNGALLPVIATGGSVNIAAGNCGNCHSATYFNSHKHHTLVNSVIQTATDLAQGAPGALCSTCHIPTPSGLITWNSVYAEHLSDCAKCHSSGRAEVTTAITTKANPTKCLNCHSAKVTPNTHGGHDASHFAGSAQCTTCHVITVTGIAEGIHKNICTMCHTTASGGTGTAKAGAGGDGNALLGVGAAPHASVTCLTCHNVANALVTPATIGGIHHNRNGTVVYDPAVCTKCHKASSHLNMIKDTPNNCKSCHSLTPDTAGTGAPVSPGDPKVHDACSTCHMFAAAPAYTGTLVAAPNTKGVTTMNPLTAATNDGGGNCVQCHTATKAAMHHVTALATAGTCQACHTNAKVDTAVAPSQLACVTCHVNLLNTTGLQITSLRLKKASGAVPTMLTNTLGATTGVTASGIVTSHTIAGASKINVNDVRTCFSCHDGTYAGAVAVTPFHGYPGDLAKGTLLVAANNKVMKDGTARMQVNEVNLNQIPLIFMYYHQGHNAFRRFSTPGLAEGNAKDFAITRRSTQNTLADNIELYRGGRGLAIPAGTVNTTGGTSCSDTVPTASDFRGLFDSGHRMKADCANVQYGGRGAFVQLAAGSRTAGTGAAGRQWEAKGFTLSFTAPYTRFNTANKPAQTVNIPYLTALTAPNDRVFVNSAQVNLSGDLVVIAKNDQGCGLLSVRTQPDNTARGVMTLNAATGYCEKTVTAIAPKPTAVDVVSSGTGAPSVLGFPVVDNTPGTITLSAATYSVNENGTSVTITVNRTGGAGAVAVDYATSDGTALAASDYTAASGTLNWADGDTAAKTFSITITNDTATEGDETVNIALTGNTVGTTLGTPNTAVLTIVDDDQPGTLSFELGSYSVAEGGASISINVTRTAGTVGAVSVDYATSNGTATAGSDYTAATGTLNWADADAANKSFSVTITQDTLVEGDETVTLTLSAAGGSATIGGTNPVTLTIIDDDNTAPTLSIAQPSGQTGQTLTAPVAITYTLADPDNVVTASFSLDTDTNSGNGTGSAITCTGGTGGVTSIEGTGLTCTWDASSSGAVGGSTYYVYGVTSDGVNPAVGAYSGSITFSSITWALASYHMMANDAGVSVGTDGTDNVNITPGAAISLSPTIATNEFRDLAVKNGTESGTDRNRLRPGAAFTATWEYVRVYTPAYAGGTTVAASATAEISAYLGAATAGVWVIAELYEYNDTSGLVGGAKGTATANLANSTAAQVSSLTFNNAQFPVAAGNRVVMLVKYTDNGVGRPALLCGATLDQTNPSGYTYFTVNEGN